MWSFDKKGWCCQHYGKGCTTRRPPAPGPAPPMPITTSPCPFDWTQGYNEWPLQWVKGWSAAKKLFCCRTAQRGCPSELPPPSGLPPNGLQANWHGAAPTSKRDASPTHQLEKVIGTTKDRVWILEVLCCAWVASVSCAPSSSAQLLKS